MTIHISHKTVFILGISGGGEFTPQQFESPPKKKSHKDATTIQ